MDNGLLTESKDCIKELKDWLTVKYSFAEYKLVLIAELNEPNKIEHYISSCSLESLGKK